MRTIIVAAIFFLLGTPAFAQELTPDEVAAETAKANAWEAHRNAVKIPAQLFPGAAEVRLYTCACGFDILITRDGPKLRRELPTNVAVLTAAEVATLRRSVFRAPEPYVVNGCIMIPKHAFLFYDKVGKLLGGFLLNTDSGYAKLLPDQKPPHNFTAVMMDFPKIAAIIQAHGAPIHLKDARSCPVR
ncbi:hypothetical protein [Rhizomicrobium electricum]|uniref:Uncharacterized protein n=1 Tax=Rhizomicrobium electricum TaxID=480070 RepID=A0ABN1EG02_9PROT|nr:hypothetical protein [Rhizomicrobium electricum]NIJ48540.1 hypothetical protein [Rhizomicrobium electricum]